MGTEKKNAGQEDKKLAARCGLFCEACSWFIAATEDPGRLERLARQSGFSEEESRCYGCRSNKRLPYCDQCRMSACTVERGIDFCGECEEYPCNDLKRFQAAMPHRIELWDNLERIGSVGYEQWFREMLEHYACRRCRTINSAYDLRCRQCGEDPSCNFVARHTIVIKAFRTAGKRGTGKKDI